MGVRKVSSSIWVHGRPSPICGIEISPADSFNPLLTSYATSNPPQIIYRRRIIRCKKKTFTPSGCFTFFIFLCFFQGENKRGDLDMIRLSDRMRALVSSQPSLFGFPSPHPQSGPLPPGTITTSASSPLTRCGRAVPAQAPLRSKDFMSLVPIREAKYCSHHLRQWVFGKKNGKPSAVLSLLPCLTIFGLNQIVISMRMSIIFCISPGPDPSPTSSRLRWRRRREGSTPTPGTTRGPSGSSGPSHPPPRADPWSVVE